MKNWIPAGLLLLFFASCGGNDSKKTEGGAPPSAGESVYEAQCVRCHGSNGKLGLSGAKDLTVTTLTPDEMVQVISDGAKGGMMPGFKESLSAEEIKAVADYIETTLKN